MSNYPIQLAATDLVLAFESTDPTRALNANVSFIHHLQGDHALYRAMVESGHQTLALHYVVALVAREVFK